LNGKTKGEKNMSTYCNETGVFIEYDSKPALARRGGDGKQEFYVCEDHINAIPMEVRRAIPCVEGDSGMNFYRMRGMQNYYGSFSGLHVEAGEFMFSLDREDAQKYIPNSFAGKSYK